MPLMQHHHAFLCLSLGLLSAYVSGTQQTYDAGEHSALFQGAIERDLSGKRLEAREYYKILRVGPLASVAAIPDAINLFSLSLDEQALDIFIKVQSNGKFYDAEYASLWILMLNAKHGRYNAFSMSESYTTQPAKLINDLYSKRITLSTFLVDLKKLSFTSEKARRDAVTQSIFFASCYAKYIEKDIGVARKMIDENRFEFLFESLERPLMDEGLCA